MTILKVATHYHRKEYKQKKGSNLGPQRKYLVQNQKKKVKVFLTASCPIIFWW